MGDALSAAKSASPHGRKSSAILLAARGLFLSQGFAAVGMEKMARVSKTSKATLYAYFATKEVLFRTVIAREIDRINAGIMSVEPRESDVRETLRRVARNFIDVFRVVATCFCSFSLS